MHSPTANELNKAAVVAVIITLALLALTSCKSSQQVDSNATASLRHDSGMWELFDTISYSHGFSSIVSENPTGTLSNETEDTQLISPVNSPVQIVRHAVATQSTQQETQEQTLTTTNGRTSDPVATTPDLTPALADIKQPALWPLWVAFGFIAALLVAMFIWLLRKL